MLRPFIGSVITPASFGCMGTKEVAAELGVTEETVRQWWLDGKLPPTESVADSFHRPVPYWKIETIRKWIAGFPDDDPRSAAGRTRAAGLEDVPPPVAPQPDERPLEASDQQWRGVRVGDRWYARPPRGAVEIDGKWSVQHALDDTLAYFSTKFDPDEEEAIFRVPLSHPVRRGVEKLAKGWYESIREVERLKGELKKPGASWSAYHREKREAGRIALLALAAVPILALVTGAVLTTVVYGRRGNVLDVLLILATAVAWMRAAELFDAYTVRHWDAAKPLDEEED
ncbi:MAG: hypothetical protein ICV64_00500 [Thermoleophilia bacterium]|nr:hypothetical protein [Thermoleophilia bacterium]